MNKFLAASAVISTIALAGSPASAQMHEETVRANLVPFYKALNAANIQEAPELIKQSTTPGWVPAGATTSAIPGTKSWP